MSKYRATSSPRTRMTIKWTSCRASSPLSSWSSSRRCSAYISWSVSPSSVGVRMSSRIAALTQKRNIRRFSRPIYKHFRFPSHFSQSQLLLYFLMHSYCYITGTYIPIGNGTGLPSRKDLQSHQILYYQWVPYIFMLQAFLFYLPHIIW